MKARIPKHREFIINFPDSIPEAKANEGWAKLQQIVDDYTNTVINEDCRKRMQYHLSRIQDGSFAKEFMDDQAAGAPKFKKLQEEYGFEYTVEYVQ